MREEREGAERVWIQEILAEFGRVGMAATGEAAERLACYVALLSRWSRRIRLTADPDPRAIIEGHLADALQAGRVLAEQRAELAPSGRVPKCVDVGSGGGLPGFAMALLCPTVRMTLIEKNARKCSFLRTAAHELGIGDTMRVITARAEFTAERNYDVACSRATFAPVAWLGHARHLVTPLGRAMVFAAHEKDLPTELDWRCERAVAYSLRDGRPRVLAVYRRRP